MSAFSNRNVTDAIARLPATGSDTIKLWLERARANKIPKLEAECEAELARRPFAFTQDAAASFGRMAVAVADMDLAEATRYAFTKARPADDREQKFLRWVAANPGGSYRDAQKAYGKGDLGLVIGHLVYHRYGCFRRFMAEGEDQSSVLLTKDRTGDSVRYQLRPEAEAVLRELGLV